MGRALCRASGVLSIAVLLALCVMAQVNAQSVRDFEEIAASPVVITPDPSGRSAVLQVDTSVDVACSVVYGEDDAFGSIAVDSDMDGGAHSEHQPVLGGLEPDSAYQYRFQGTAADGTIYVSEVMTFSTPPAPVDGPPDLARDAVVTGVSSEFSAAFAAANAFDGDGNTEWSTRGDGDDAWVEIDLGDVRTIASITFRTRSMADGTAVTETFSLTADGEPSGTFPADTTVNVQIEAQRLRFDVESSSGGNTGAVEILVLGAADDAP